MKLLLNLQIQRAFSHMPSSHRHQGAIHPDSSSTRAMLLFFNLNDVSWQLYLQHWHESSAGPVIQWCFTVVSNNHNLCLSLKDHAFYRSCHWHVPNAGNKEKNSHSIKKLKDVLIHDFKPQLVPRLALAALKGKWFIFPLSLPADVQWW